jgi:hypothetical protein
MRERNQTPVRVTGLRRKPDARGIVIVGAVKGSSDEPLPFSQAIASVMAWTIGMVPVRSARSGGDSLPTFLTDEL